MRVLSASLTVCILASASTGAYAAASFDCDKASSSTERLICSDSELSDDDKTLATVFAQAREVAKNRKQFSDESKAAWEWRESNCTDKNCLLQWYSKRTAYYRNLRDSALAGDIHKNAVGTIEVTAAKLYSEYSSNELSADQKYKGKLLKVSGFIDRIGRDINGDPFMSIAGSPIGYGSSFQTVTAYFDRGFTQQLSQGRRGNPVTITCYGRGLVVINPILDCHR